MPLACSEAPRRRGRLGWLLAALPLTLAATLPAVPPAEARGRNAWLRGSFPVASFSGYTSPYGMRSHPLYGGLRPHQGLDIAAPLGSAVRSWWSGTVVEVIEDGGCGNGLVIRSGDYEHIYCHLGGSVDAGWYRSGAVALRVGQRVRTGEVIAHVGLTGSTTGPHLHWGLRHRGAWMDPARVLRAMAASRRRFAPKAASTLNVGQFR
jgi:murein DD-endopeptidase MepM/ murein hydrolase activator NlpD